MFSTLLTWILLLALAPSAYPLARALLGHSQQNDGPALTAALALALGVGGLTLSMLLMGVLGIRFTTAGIGALYAIALLTATLLTQRGRVRPPPPVPLLPASGWARLALLVIGLVSAAILFNAVYWPFTRDDAVALYHPFGQMMAATGALPPLTGADSLYHAYPMSISLIYAFAYLTSGWDNEYAARLIPALMALACLPVVYALGRRLNDAWAGWAAALLLALTPAFGAWASSGYVDLPMAFLYALAALFILRAWEGGAAVDALLAGVCLGLAAWTKNAALVGGPLLAAALGYAVLRHRLTLRAALLSLLACGLVAGPWYLRNLIGAGFLIPDTAWTDQAQRTFANLLPYLTRPANFGLPGGILTAGLLVGLMNAARGQFGALLLSAWVWPFLLTWWAFASYDPRFLLLFLPPACALGGALLAQAWSWLNAPTRRAARPAVALIVAALTVLTVYFSVEYKDEFLRDPLMSHTDKLAVVADRR